MNRTGGGEAKPVGLTPEEMSALKDQKTSPAYQARDKLTATMADARQMLLALSVGESGWKKVKAAEIKSSQTIHLWCKEVTATVKRQVEPSKDAPKGYIKKNKRYKIWRCVTEIHAPPEEVFRVLTDVATVRSWNANVKNAKIIDKLDGQTDLNWLESADNLSGAFASRDFVGLRRIEPQPDGGYIICTVGIVDQKVPLVKGNVRGWSGPGGFIVQPIVDPNPSSSSSSSSVANGQSVRRCKLIWVLNADARAPSWIPEALMDKTMASVMTQTVHGLRQAATRNRRS